MTKRGRPPHPDCLTPAEWRVVEGVRHGLTNPAIAERTGLSLNAVKLHVSSTLGKLGFRNRRALQQWSGVRADSVLADSVRPGKEHPAQAQAWVLGQVTRVTRDLQGTAAWLRDIVGFREVLRFDDMVFFDAGGVRLYVSVGDPATNSILYFRVDDIHAEIERLRAAAVEIVSAPHRIHVHDDGSEEWMAFFRDPDGCALALMAVVRSRDTTPP